MRGPREETVERQETASSGVGKSEEMSSATPEFREYAPIKRPHDVALFLT